MVRTDEYEARFQSIISAWLPPEDDMHGETVLLIDGNKRYIRKDGLVCVTIVKAKDGTSAIDADFRLEQALLDEVSKAPVVSRQPSKESTGLRLGRRELVDSMAITVVNDDTKALIASSVSENTLRNYRYWSKEIEAWLGGRSLDDGLLAEYITGLHAQGKSPATISQAVAAVRWQAKNAGIEIVGEVTTRTLAGIRREGKDRGRGQVEGLTWADVERVCAFAEMDKSIAGLRDSALIRLMSDCLLRVSEAVAVNLEDLKAKTLLVRSSKTDQEGLGEQLYITSDTRRIVRRYCERAGIDSGALFRSVKRGDHIQCGRLTSRSARRQIIYWSELAGVEGFISGHSLRVGSAVSLAKAGASVVEMQVAGRWKSSQMPAHYAKAELAERGAIARFKEKRRGG